MVLVGPFDCTVIGEVFLDVVVKAGFDYGRLFRGGTSYCDLIKPVLGGSGNVAVGLSMLGGKAAFVGKAGDDFFGKLYARDLKNSGVFSKVFFERQSSTGLIIVFVGENERSFLVFRGANDKLSSSDIEKALDLIRNSSFVYFSGYSLVNNPQKNAILRAIDLAKESNVKIVFDPGAHNLVKSKQRLFEKLLGLCDVFSPNLDEALAITKATNIKELIEELKERVPLTALKCGKDGSVLISRKEVVKVESYDVRHLDTTGAGDAFTAALIYGLTRRMQLPSIGKLVNWFAAEVVTNVGSRNYRQTGPILCRS